MADGVSEKKVNAGPKKENQKKQRETDSQKKTHDSVVRLVP